MSRISTLIKHSNHPVLNVYFTAGHPNIHSIIPIIKGLKDAGVDIIELGMPYSDPLADGKTIQDSSAIALKGGMKLDILFEKMFEVRNEGIDIPIIMMGYFNQMLQYGVDKYISNCKKSGIDGLILPDLPPNIFEKSYKHLFEKAKLGVSFLVTPNTEPDRIKKANDLSTDFLYVVSQSSITGNTENFSKDQIEYFQKIQSLHLSTPHLIGFGIHDSVTFHTASKYAYGAIVGSAFIRHLNKYGPDNSMINTFVNNLRKN